MIERFSRLFLVVALLFCAATASADENRGAPWQRAACAPDAFRLCSSLIPDAARAESCLRQKQVELSNACIAFFARKAFAQRPALANVSDPRRRAQEHDLMRNRSTQMEKIRWK
jgi:hypothetical protein